jgi:hypothetical protein
VVVGATDPGQTTTFRAAEVERLISDMKRLRGPLRIAVRHTDDGLGIYVPPPRRIGPVLFLCCWLAGWAAGEYFAVTEFLRGGFSVPSLFLLIWIVPWTMGGAAVIWACLWQFFGEERLFFTAGALVREWNLFAQRRRRVVMGSEILSVEVDGAGSDLAGLGTVKVATTGKAMRIGSGLDIHEAELVAELIRQQSAG